MLIFVLRYLFVYWILLGSNASEETLLRDLNLDVKDYPIAACKLRCVRRMRAKVSKKQQTNLHNQTCVDQCLHKNSTNFMHSEIYRQLHINYRMTLVCRDDRSLTFRITIFNNGDATNDEEVNGDDGSINESLETEKIYESAAIQFQRENEESVKINYTKATQMQSKIATATAYTKAKSKQQMIKQQNETIYLVKVQSDTNVMIRTFNETFFTINELKNSTTYKISAVSVNAKREYAIVASEQEFTTLPRDYTPGLVSEMKLKRFLADETNEMHLKAEITWQPTIDRTCHYNIIYFDENQGSDMTPMEIRDRSRLYTYKLENLTFSAVYKIGIRAKNTNNDAKESEMSWFKVQTPSCAEWYNNNFNICRPFAPEGLKIVREYVRANTYSLNITWRKPEHPVSYYTIMIVDHVDGGQDYNFIIDADANKLFIPEIRLNGTLFDVHLSAFTPGGNSSVVLQEANSQPVMLADKIGFIMILIYVVIIVLSFVIITSVFILLHRYRAKVNRHAERCKYFEDLEKKTPNDEKNTFDFPKKNLLTSSDALAQFQLDLEDKLFLNDSMEIDRTDVTLHEVLGEGAFGLVRRGTYNDGKSGAREVAVKMLKDRPSVDDVRAFRCEIEVMKSVERHPNIVGIIGHCTRRYNEMLLITEYCSFGNLLDFLRDEWKYLYDLNMKCNSPSMRWMSTRLHTYSARRHQRRERHSLTLTRRPICSDSGSNNSNHLITNECDDGDNDRYAMSKSAADGNLIERLKFKYKYKSLNAAQARCINTAATTTTAIYPPLDDLSATTTMTSITTINDASAPPPPPTPLQSPPPLPSFIAATRTTAADNKSYGYDEICSSNECKYDHMDYVDDVKNGGVQIGNVNMKHEVGELAHCIHINSDKYQQQQTLPMKRKKHARCGAATYAAAIENKSYFRILPEIISEAALRQRQWQRRQARNAERNRTLAALEQMPVNVCASTAATTTTTTAISSAQTTAENCCNETLSSCVRREPLSTADLLDIARQVAVGMEFLAKNKVVHRDLAARNVLVAPDRTIKIADFGLSRDIYQENVYKKTGNGKLPIKWLALESMTHQVYTTQSDVWSYGILLYEIVTLGGTPYPMIPTNRLLHLLKNGYRMQKPKNCGTEFYNLMYACWNINPGERPSFNEIIKILDQILRDEPERQFGNILGVPNMECLERGKRTSLLLQTTKNNQTQYQEQQFQEQHQSTHLDETEMDATNMDDSYLKPL